MLSLSKHGAGLFNGLLAPNPKKERKPPMDADERECGI